MSNPEERYVETPFVEQLRGMGWEIYALGADNPLAFGRSSFGEVLLRDKLVEALAKLNPWINEDQIETAISALEKPAAHKLMECNRLIHNRLLEGVEVSMPEGRNRSVAYIDYVSPEKNSYLAITQFKVRGVSQEKGKKHIIPDIVLFVNGIPLVVVECKSPSKNIDEAIEQLQRYTNQRYDEQREGREELFWYNQLLVATNFNKAVVSTVCSSSTYYKEWKDTSPLPLKKARKQLGVNKLSSQQKLVAGMLQPENLIDLVRHFIVFKDEGSKTTKIVARYQQFRAVQNAVRRLLQGQTREEDGFQDRRGGIIWHTQGSGKSLTMMFMVRKMRSMPALRKFKVVFVTDRTSLQNQLSDSGKYSGNESIICESSQEVKEVLSQKGPGLVFVMIQKFLADKQYPLLNASENILVMVDEAHRTHTKKLHANLSSALPNCAKIGFTGTPIIMKEQKRTTRIFGSYIDRYTIKQSEKDNSTLKIMYEGRTSKGAVKEGKDLDELFEYYLPQEWSEEEKEAAIKKYSSQRQIMESKELIKAKARDILRHYVDNIMPEGFKGQVVAYSRRAAMHYLEAFKQARQELVKEIKAVDPSHLHQVESKDSAGDFYNRAHDNLARIKTMKFAPVFSGSHNDPPGWGEYSDKNKIRKRVENFKQLDSDLRLLIVKSMLLTGFDAPVDQVLYLDRGMQGAELLQAIARVNRPKDGKKKCGYVIDYYGVTANLREALKIYSDEDIKEIEDSMGSPESQLPRLRNQAFKVKNMFEDIYKVEKCVEELEDEKKRAQFDLAFKKMMAMLDPLLYRPEAQEYQKLAKQFSEIRHKTRNRYRDNSLIIGEDITRKVQSLIDKHLVSLGVQPRIPPISLTDDGFEAHLRQQESPRARASEMEHALKYHIRTNMSKDPVFYRKLSERLEEMLNNYREKWETLLLEMQKLGDEAKGRTEKDLVFKEKSAVYGPYYRVLEDKVEADKQDELKELTEDLVDYIREQTSLKDFWKKSKAQEDLVNNLFVKLDNTGFFSYEDLEKIATELRKIARANK